LARINLREETNLSYSSFQRYAASALCCAATSILLTACGGGGDTGAPQMSAAESTVVASGSEHAAEAAQSSAMPGPYGQDANVYTLSFSDEFENGFNSDVWSDTVWYEKRNDTENYAVEDGKLKIWPQRDASGKFFNRTIDTDGKYYQTYGYFEMEAKLPYGKGTWPAFWLLNHDHETQRPEIDILEAYAGGGPGSGWSDASMRPTAFASTVWPDGIQSGRAAGTKTFTDLGDLSAGFHKYGVKWEPNKITFYLDGKEMYSVNASMSSRMYILLDLWFGSASGDPDDSTPQGKDNSYEIQYVRAWQFK
jgi:beta-glucanase (GH16 family)